MWDGGWTPVMKMDGNKVPSSLCQALRQQGHQSLCMGVSDEIEREDCIGWDELARSVSNKKKVQYATISCSLEETTI